MGKSSNATWPWETPGSRPTWKIWNWNCWTFRNSPTQLPRWNLLSWTSILEILALWRSKTGPKILVNRTRIQHVGHCETINSLAILGFPLYIITFVALLTFNLKTSEVCCWRHLTLSGSGSLRVRWDSHHTSANIMSWTFGAFVLDLFFRVSSTARTTRDWSWKKKCQTLTWLYLVDFSRVWVEKLQGAKAFSKGRAKFAWTKTAGRLDRLALQPFSKPLSQLPRTYHKGCLNRSRLITFSPMINKWVAELRMCWSLITRCNLLW